MGLKMNSIHTPTVATPSQPLTSEPTNLDSRKALLELMNQRDGVEEELKALSSVLVSHGVDMDTPLLTPDGFPRSDIDVAQIRTTRARIIWLRNDYKTLTSKMEAGLHAHHAALQSAPPSSDSTTGAGTSGFMGSDSTSSGPAQPHAFSGSSLEPPFAKVNSIVDGSPADSAGLMPGDEVRRFGTANWTNHERLAQVAQIVQRGEGREILVKVKRKEAGGRSKELDLTLVPRRNWGGRGMLGCHLVPM